MKLLKALLLSLLIFLIQNQCLGQSEPKDLSKLESDSIVQTGVIDSLAAEHSSLYDAHIWFAQQEFELAKSYFDLKKSLRLYAMTSNLTTLIDTIDVKRKIRLGIDYSLPLNTTNFTFGLNILNHDKWDVYALGIVGSGSRDNPVIGNSHTRVKANVGLGIEGSWQLFKTVSPLLGANYLSVYPDSGATGSNLNFYVGLRYLSPLQTKYYRFAADVKVGKPFWSGFGNINGGHDTYISAGLNMVSAKPFGSAGAPALAPLETSLLYEPGCQTVAAKMTLPYRIFEQLSLGASIYLGTDARTPFYDQREISSNFGYGVDLRLYGDQLEPILNPFITAQWGTWEYEAGDKPRKGNLIQIGNRLRINRNLYLDLFTGPAFWKRTVTDRNTGQVLNEPSSWDAGFGLTYRMELKKDRTADAQINVSSEIVLLPAEKNLAKVKGLPDNGFVDLSAENKLDEELSSVQAQALQVDGKLQSRFTLVEKKFYIVGNLNAVDTVYTTANFGDLTDIKFFAVDAGMTLGIKKRHQIPFLNKADDTDEGTLLVAVFDKHRTRVDLINRLNPNMYLHFVDLDSGRYFGYRFDTNRRMQPEYRNLPLNPTDTTSEICYGKYEDYVRRMEWMTGEEFVEFMDVFQIKKQWLADRIFEKMDHDNPTPDITDWSSDPTRPPLIKYISENYQIAYVEYPTDIINKIEKQFRKFGASIMFRFDGNGNFRQDDPLGGHFLTVEPVEALKDTVQGVAPQNIYLSTDFRDFCFFSNVIGTIPRHRNNKCEININGFDLGSAVLKPEHKQKIQQWLQSMDCEWPKINIIGSVDATKYPPADLPRQQELARQRALSTQAYLMQLLGNSTIIEAIAPGIKENNPDERAAQIIIDAH